MNDTVKAMVPKKHTNKMQTLELMVIAVIGLLPALTSDMTVQHAAWVMAGATLLRIYLGSIKQS